MKNLFLLFFQLCLVQSLFAQVGPGGVGTSSTVAFWVDVHTDGGGNGFKVSQLTDYSGSSNNFTQATSANQPTYVTNAFNGVDGLSFSGSEWMNAGAKTALNGNSYFDFYYFGKNNTPSSLAIPLNYDYGPGRSIFTGALSLSGSNQVFGHNSAYQARRTPINMLTSYGLYHGKYDVPTGTLTALFDFVQQSQITNANSPAAGTHVGLNLGGTTAGNSLDGEILEAFAFNVAINTAEQKILENYISAKYGTTIPVDQYAYEATHQFGVIGIGRDDIVNRQLEAIGNGIVRIQKASLSNGDYLYIGHDGAVQAALSTDVPAAIPNSSRLLRTWRMDETVDIGAITITFELDNTTNFSPTPASYQLIVDTDGVFATGATTTAGVYDALAQTVTFTGINLNAGDYFTLIGDEPQSIFSIATGNWDNTSTWNCSCVPSALNEVTVSASDTVTVNVAAAAKQINIEALGVLTWTGTNELSIHGDSLVVDGEIIANTGKVSMVGTANQYIDLNSSQSDFFDFEVNNTGGDLFLLNGTLLIDGTLTPESGAFDVSAAELIINSEDALGGGRIDEIGVNGSFVGDVTVRRFIPSGVAGIRNLASPVTNATLAQWDDDLLISGIGFPDGCAYGFLPTTGATGCYYSVKYMKEGSYVIPLSTTDVLINGVGYEVFMGDNLSTFSGTTIDVSGGINTTDVTTPTLVGWNTLGNPYASPVLFSQALLTNFLGEYFYVFDPAAGAYQWYDKVANTSSVPELASGLLAVGQGFWVKDFGFLTFPQTSKTSSSATYIRNSQVENALQLTLKQDNSTFFSVTSLAFNEEASDEVDHFDIHYLSTGLEPASSLYMVYDDTLQLTKNYLLNDGDKKVVDFRMRCKTNSFYTISPSNLQDLQDYDYVYLFDKSLNKMVDLRQAETYTFYETEGDKDRFTVILTNERLADKTYVKDVSNDVANNEISIKQLGHTLEISTDLKLENATVEVTNVVGQKIMTDFNLGTTESATKQYITIGNDHSGIFIAVVRSGGNVVATKKIIL